MRVLCVGARYPPDGHGGYEQHCASVVGHLRGRGHAVEVLTSRGPGGGRHEGVHRVLVRFPQQPQVTAPALAARAERHNAAALARRLEAFRPDVVSWWRLGELSVSMVERVARAGVPAVGMVCDPWMLEAPARDPWWRQHMRRRPDYERAAAWLFVSRDLRRRVAAAGVAVDRAPIVHAGVELDRFERRAAATPWRWRLLYAGRLSALKGVDTAIAALAHLPATATLDVVGDGERAPLGALAARLGVGDRVTFAPACSRSALAARFRAADAVLFPVRWPESWGLVPLEAMACGVPGVATGTGGSGEYLRHGHNALLVRPDQPQALAAAVVRLAADEPLRAHLAARGRATAEAHPAWRAAELVAGHLERAASTPSAASSAWRMQSSMST